MTCGRSAGAAGEQSFILHDAGFESSIMLLYRLNDDGVEHTYKWTKKKVQQFVEDHAGSIILVYEVVVARECSQITLERARQNQRREIVQICYP